MPRIPPALSSPVSAPSEYLTSLLIAVMILITGFELLKSSVELIIHPEEMRISYVALIIVAVSAGVKLLLGTFTIREGKRVDSGSRLELVIETMYV